MVDGTPKTLIFDSGAERTLVNSRDLNVERRVTFIVGSKAMGNFPIVLTDLSDMNIAKVGADGVLGEDVLRKFSFVRIDYRNQVVELEQRERMDELLGRQSASSEAKALYRMIGDEHSVEELRKLIAVPAWVERVLLDYAGEFPEDACWISSCLRFRQAVAREFERLIGKGAAIADVPEADATEEIFAGAPA